MSARSEAQRSPAVALAGAEVTLVGELTIHCAGERRDSLGTHLEAGVDLTVNLAGVTEMDTTGLQLLLALRRELERNGRRLALADPSPVAREVLSLTHLDTNLEPVGGAGDADLEVDR